MSWVNEDDQLVEARVRNIEARFDAYIRDARGERLCDSCKNVYRPLMSMGRFECRVHPENLNHSVPLPSVGHARRLADGNIGKGARMDHDRLPFDRLQEGRINGIAHKSGHGVADFKVARGHGVAAFVEGDGDVIETFFQICEVICN